MVYLITSSTIYVPISIKIFFSLAHIFDTNELEIRLAEFKKYFSKKTEQTWQQNWQKLLKRESGNNFAITDFSEQYVQKIIIKIWQLQFEYNRSKLEFLSFSQVSVLYYKRSLKSYSFAIVLCAAQCEKIIWSYYPSN